jgi:hypothetical protein
MSAAPNDVGAPPAPAPPGPQGPPPWWHKVLRVFVFAFLGTFLTTILPIADKIAKGEHVDYNFIKAIAVSAIAAGFAAGIRAVIALLPVFRDDNDIGMQKS